MHTSGNSFPSGRRKHICRQVALKTFINFIWFYLAWRHLNWFSYLFPSVQVFFASMYNLNMYIGFVYCDGSPCMPIQCIIIHRIRQLINRNVTSNNFYTQIVNATLCNSLWIINLFNFCVRNIIRICNEDDKIVLHFIYEKHLYTFVSTHLSNVRDKSNAVTTQFCGILYVCLYKSWKVYVES